ncbi:hypothetical protein AJ78_07763 [Emergomyces pasteurianus Ep9510]|uniref:Uncharacterized protein n=1 Tax=Emergomyces pasteurianus Ep9510 TaxID=1447872 RepID=A0A1J9PUC8_9EURO|nr:hypothetical protein AJ78_07763 [Emergomyces pasteurianus Ep9510]
MGTFTCKETSDAVIDHHLRLSPIHMREDNVTTPFLYIPSCSQNDGMLSTSIDTVVPPHYASDTAQSPFNISSDAIAYYTTVEATDVKMQHSRSPAISELDPLTPGTTFSTTSNETGPDESRCLIRASANSSSQSSTSSRSRKCKHKESKPNTSISRTSSCSTGRHRSLSQGITSRSSSVNRRKSSKHQSHRAGTYTQILRKGDSVLCHRKEDLVMLHRNSCRIFEFGSAKPDAGAGEGSHTSKHVTPRSKLDRSSTAPTENSLFTTSRIAPLKPNKSCCAASPSLAPLLASSTQSPPTSPAFPSEYASPETERHHNWGPVTCNSPSDGDLQRETLQEYKPIPVTVIDWTSPSTRRREYEKIDRSTRGVRGIWRRIAPRWCQPGYSMTPFFEEGKGGKGMYEGSVRRFRMDVPDRDNKDNNNNGCGGDDATKESEVINPSGNEKAQQSSKVKWKWIESSISTTESIRGKEVRERDSIHGKWRCLSIMRKN